MRGTTWVYNPHVGGVKIPADVQERTKKRILTHAQKNYKGKFLRLDIRFRGALCYIDAFTEPVKPTKDLLKVHGETEEQYYERMRNFPLHLCRLRYFKDEEKWSLAFFKYSDMKYEPCIFENGTFVGTPEEAFDVGAVYLID